MSSRRDFLAAAVAAAASGTAVRGWSQSTQDSNDVRAELVAAAAGDEYIALLLYHGFTPLGQENVSGPEKGARHECHQLKPYSLLQQLFA